MPFQFTHDSPVLFIPYPKLDKISAAVIYTLIGGPLTEEKIHAVLFLASNHHFPTYGRPIVGDTWLRGFGLCGIFGVLLSAVIGNMKRQHILDHGSSQGISPPTDELHLVEKNANREETMDQLSESDRDSIILALQQVKNLSNKKSANNKIKFVIQTTALYGTGETGTPVDWMAALPNAHTDSPEARSDIISMLIHSA